MKLLFKQRLFSWFDSYDIYDEAGNTVYVVKGQLSWGHKLVIYDAYGNEVGMVVQKVLTFLPKFEIYKNGSYIGCADVCTGNRCRKMFQKLIVDLVTVIIRRMEHGIIQKENHEKNI